MRYARGHNPVGVGDICLSKPKVALADSGNLGLEGRTPLGFQAHASGMKTNFPSHRFKPKTAIGSSGTGESPVPLNPIAVFGLNEYPA